MMESAGLVWAIVLACLVASGFYAWADEQKADNRKRANKAALPESENK